MKIKDVRSFVEDKTQLDIGKKSRKLTISQRKYGNQKGRKDFGARPTHNV